MPNNSQVRSGEQIQLTELIDINDLRVLFESYSKSTLLPTALLDLDGNILIATNWQESCTNFHRVNSETCANCLESDTAIANAIQEGNDYNLYRCKNGLVDVATPIKIFGEHVANFFIGQFFLEDSRPNIDEYKEKARKHGFPEEAYLKAIKKVPVYSENQIKEHMKFLGRLAELIGKMGAKNFEIKKLNTELSSGVERLGDLINHMQRMVKVGGWELDASTMETYWTKGVFEIYGLPSGTPMNKINGISYYAPHDQKRIEKCVTDCIRSGIEFDEEFDFINHRGEKLIVRSIGKPVSDENGNIIKLRGSFQDITAKRQQEKELAEERLKSMQAARLATLGEMAAGIAHEINNPLAIVSGAISMLGKEHIPEEKKAKYIENVKQSVVRISKIVNGLKKFSRSSKMSDIKEICLSKLASECMEMILPKSTRDMVPVHSKVQEDIYVYADEIQLEQILINLLANAIDANKNLDKAWVEIISYGDEDWDYIAVKDSGTGIDNKIIAKLFDPFYTTKEVGKGTGLGLSISKGIAEDHGGDITYKLIDGHTAFVVKLPKKKANAIAS